MKGQGSQGGGVLEIRRLTGGVSPPQGTGDDRTSEEVSLVAAGVANRGHKSVVPLATEDGQ